MEQDEETTAQGPPEPLLKGHEPNGVWKGTVTSVGGWGGVCVAVDESGGGVGGGVALVYSSVNGWVKSWKGVVVSSGNGNPSSDGVKSAGRLAWLLKSPRGRLSLSADPFDPFNPSARGSLEAASICSLAH